MGHAHSAEESAYRGAQPARRPQDRGLSDPRAPGSVLHLQAAAGNAAVTAWVQRAVDPSKAAKIDDILNHSIGWVSNAKLERAWAELGTDLPEAINDPVFRGLWLDSVTKEGISLRDAGAPLLEQFKRDVLATARTRLSGQLTRMTSLKADLDKPQPLASVLGPRATGSGTDRSMPPPRDPLSASGVVDAAAYLDYLLNWESILRSVPVAVRRGASPLLPTPAPKKPQPDLGPLLGPMAVPAPEQNLVTFDPNADDASLLNDPSVEYLNTAALQATRAAYLTSLMNAPLYRRRAEMMMATDPNLAALAEARELRTVSKLSGASETDARTALQLVAKRNLEALERFQSTLRAPPPELWKALGPVHQQLLAGESDSSSRDWSSITAKGFVLDLFAHGKETAAERDAARAKLIADLVIAAAVFAAALASGGALTTVFLASVDAAMVASQKQASDQAGRHADAVENAADANLATRDASTRARQEADSKDAQLIAGVVLSLLPFIPQLRRGLTAGSEALAAFLRTSGTAARGAAAATEGIAPVAATLRPRATRAQLQEMLANKQEYATWATRDAAVAQNATIRLTGRTNPAHPADVLSLFAGVGRGNEYGPWKVIVRRQGRYTGYEAVGAAGEIKINTVIDPGDSWWFHVDDLKGL